MMTTDRTPTVDCRRRRRCDSRNRLRSLARRRPNSESGNNSNGAENRWSSAAAAERNDDAGFAVDVWPATARNRCRCRYLRLRTGRWSRESFPAARPIETMTGVKPICTRVQTRRMRQHLTSNPALRVGPTVNRFSTFKHQTLSKFENK